MFESETDPVYNRICGDCTVENRRINIKEVSYGGRLRNVDRGM